MAETAITQRIRLALTSLGFCRIFRNNVGQVIPKGQNRPISFGLFPGSGDLIGWRTVRVTKEMVGRDLAVFTSIEVKNEEGGKVSDAQKKWKENVLAAGGIAMIVNSPEEALLQLSNIQTNEQTTCPKSHIKKPAFLAES